MVAADKKLRVFLASPGDVAQERRFVREFLQDVVPHDPHLKHVTFELVSWDDPHHGTTMPAHLTPQEAVRRFHGDPASCQIVVVILATRLGTHLDLGTFRKADGSAYLSGTEWEYENAWDASPRPEILVYRRTPAPLIAADDPQRDEKHRQWDNVQAFFKRFDNPDGSARGGFWPYDTSAAFEKKFAADIRNLIAGHSASPPRDAPPTVLPVPTLPPPLAPPGLCLGRTADTAAIVRALCSASPAAVLVQGGPGIGKTTLTREAASHPDLIARFGPRRWFVPLETATAAETFDTAVIQAVGLDATAGFGAALARLAEAPTLLVLDNLETPWEAAGGAVEARLGALAAVPGTALLTSFRGQDAVLGLRWTLRHPVGQLSPADAAALFRDIAPDIPADDPCLMPLLAALGGVPLAITLAARRAAPHHSLAALWHEWQSVGTALADWQGADTPRLGSIERSIELSLRSTRLTDAGRRLFGLLGCLPSGMAAEDIRTLLGPAAFAARTELRAVGLAEERNGRLDLLPPVRDHASRCRKPEGADTAAWCEHYLGLARSLGPKAGAQGGAEAIARLAPEVANLEAAFAAARTADARNAAVAAAYGFAELLRFSGLGAPAVLHALADSCRNAKDAAGEANCKRLLGDIALARSQHDAARAAYEQALPLYRQVGAVLGEADCIRSLGDIALRRSEHDAARAAYEQALPLYRQVGDVLGEANCIQRLGNIALARSQHEAARAAYEQALPLFRRVGDVLGEANCIKSLGNIALARSQHDAARAAYQQALPLYRQVGDVLGEANCIRSLGDIALARSEHDAARAAYQQALPLYRQVGDVVGEANCILSLGDLARAMGDRDEARRQFADALARYQGIGWRNNVALAHERLATVTNGAKRAAHVAAARETWLEIGLPEQAERVR